MKNKNDILHILLVNIRFSPKILTNKLCHYIKKIMNNDYVSYFISNKRLIDDIYPRNNV